MNGKLELPTTCAAAGGGRFSLHSCAPNDVSGAAASIAIETATTIPRMRHWAAQTPANELGTLSFTLSLQPGGSNAFQLLVIR